MQYRGKKTAPIRPFRRPAAIDHTRRWTNRWNRLQNRGFTTGPTEDTREGKKIEQQTSRYCRYLTLLNTFRMLKEVFYEAGVPAATGKTSISSPTKLLNEKELYGR